MSKSYNAYCAHNNLQAVSVHDIGLNWDILNYSLQIVFVLFNYCSAIT